MSTTLKNASPANNAEYLFNLVTTLISAGWTRRGSSDGTAFDNTGAVNHWNDVAHVNHAGAWWRGRDVGGAGEIVIQFNGTAGIRIKYSNAAQFSGGSPGATQVPSATDEGVVAGGGTDGSPSYATAFPGSPGTQQIYADGNSAPYPFYSIGYPSGGGDPNHAIVYDAADNEETGDSDSVMLWAGSSSVLKASTLCDSTVTSCPHGWMYLDVSLSKAFGTIPMQKLVDVSGNVIAPNGLINSPRLAKDPTLAITYARSSALTSPKGYRGTSRLFRWVCVPHSTPQQGSASIAGDREIAGDLVCTWDPAAGAWG